MKLICTLVIVSSVNTLIAAEVITKTDAPQTQRPTRATTKPGYHWVDVPTSKFTYVIPDPVVKLLEPNGFSVTVRADDGIMDLLIYGGLNNESKLSPFEPYKGSINGRAEKVNGNFVYKNRDIVLRDGDVCVYHLVAIKDLYMGTCGKYGLRFRVNLHTNKMYSVFQDLDDD